MVVLNGTTQSSKRYQIEVWMKKWLLLLVILLLMTTAAIIIMKMKMRAALLRTEAAGS